MADVDMNEPLIDPRLIEWANELQAKYIRAVNEFGGYRAAGRALGVDHASIIARIDKVRGVAALAGYSPDHDMVHTVPKMFKVQGTSTYYGIDGKPRGQWVKTTLNNIEAEQAVRDFVADLAAGVSHAPLVRGPASPIDDLLSVYPVGDPHFGMLAHAEETGDADFDLEANTELVGQAVDYLVGMGPCSATGLILVLGDLLHADNRANRSERSGNPMDVSARWPFAMRAARRALVRAVLRALEKHARVVVRLVPGNHDWHSTLALAQVLEAYFEAEPRVQVETSPAAHWYFRFGKVLIGATHGDTSRPEDLGGIMAADRPVDWGETAFRYWYQGHIHHTSRGTAKESPGAVWESFRTLAPRDAWHAASGYRAGRDMNVIVHHRLFGEVQRHRCDVSMLQAAS